ncbi:hypothetical protein H5P28_07860 [Ruficoccus amylovorans]|uniref:Uncharacterized protein n=1 Tax=Ruficoccus amylovorans TaxID=1804625 RepID=A0A842HCF7_9BACT|nr:hypothetical protein [Ruficoccus amylovorans]MBC2594175.1 hypothetical protein [Ruficoccus amylovorans]
MKFKKLTALSFACLAGIATGCGRQATPPERPLSDASASSAEKQSSAVKPRPEDDPVQSVAAAYESRRDRLRSTTFGMTAEDYLAGRQPDAPDGSYNVFGSYASTALRLGLQPEAANRTLREICASLGEPRSRNKTVVDDSGFTMMELVRVYNALNGSPLLEPATREAIVDALCRFDFSPKHGSENHLLVFWTARYLIAQHMPDVVFSAYKGKTGAELAREDGERLKRFIRYRARQGWGEFDSGGYMFLSFNAILSLYDFSQDEELKTLAGMMANVMLADMAVDTVFGVYGGARGRVKGQVLDQGRDGERGSPPMYTVNELQYLYFGLVDPEPESGQERLLSFTPMNYWQRSNESLFSSFRPLDIVVRIALDRPEPYVNKERKHLHNMADVVPLQPLEGSIRKYTWYTPQYIMGSLQWQDPYPADLKAGVYAKHQQHDGGLSIPHGTSTHIFVHHPGNGDIHTYWEGDFGCLCRDSFQHKAAQLSLFEIPDREPYQLVHAYFPRENFDEVTEKDGWIFARCGDVYAALYLTDGYTWTTSGKWAGRELTSAGSRKGAVLEAGSRREHGSFEAFCQEVLGNEVIFDPETMSLSYDSASAGLIELHRNGARTVDGQPVDLDYPTYDCPYLQSRWDSGVIDFIHGDRRVRMDFNKAEIITEPAEVAVLPRHEK